MGAWTIEKVIADFPRRDRAGTQRIVVGISQYAGRPYGFIHEFFVDKETGEPRPTRKGLTLNFLCLCDLAEALDRLINEMDENYSGPFGHNPRLARLLDLNG